MCQYNCRSSGIINLPIKTYTVPSIWKIAKIIPVFRSGESTKPENHQPISILPIASKILEKAVHHNLIMFLENKNLFTDCQYGFHSKWSTKLATTLFCDNAQWNKQWKTSWVCIYWSLQGIWYHSAIHC